MCLSRTQAPVRRYLPKLIDLVLNGTINPGKVFDLTLPLDQMAEGLSRDGRAPRDQDAASTVGALRRAAGTNQKMRRFTVSNVIGALMNKPEFFVTPGYGERNLKLFHYSQAVKMGVGRRSGRRCRAGLEAGMNPTRNLRWRA